MTSQTTDKQRELFESWYRINYPDPVHPDDFHANRVMRDNWFVVWQAAKGQPAISSDNTQTAYNLLTENEQLKRVQKAAKDIAVICGSDLETHFGRKYGGALRRALAAAEQIGKE